MDCILSSMGYTACDFPTIACLYICPLQFQQGDYFEGSPLCRGISKQDELTRSMPLRGLTLS